jgi:hypothetical protein
MQMFGGEPHRKSFMTYQQDPNPSRLDIETTWAPWIMGAGVVWIVLIGAAYSYDNNNRVVTAANPPSVAPSTDAP